MEKNIKIKFYLDLIMSITLLITALTGIINLIIFILGDDVHKFLGLKPDNWIIIHGTFAIATVALIFVHLILHKNWIVFTSKKLFEKNPSDKD
jgi:hypothetical protein